MLRGPAPINICQSTGLFGSCSLSPTGKRHILNCRGNRAGRLAVSLAVLHLRNTSLTPWLPPGTNSTTINVSSASIYLGSIHSPPLISLGKYFSELCRGKVQPHYSTGRFRNGDAVNHRRPCGRASNPVAC